MIRSYLRPFAITLAVAVLLMLGATTGSAFAHEIQHSAHHTAGTHGTGVCAWMCVTAGSVTSAAIISPAVTVVEEAVPHFLSSPHSSESFSQLHARAPPVLL